MTPYYQDDSVTLYHGDCRVLALGLNADAVFADPPYGETSLDWDKWPSDWADVAATIAPQLWCFGSMRMFLQRYSQFSQWQLAQDLVWEKHNGTNPTQGRFRRVHELALHFYRGDWASIYREPQVTNDATARTVRRKARPPQWGDIGASSYASEDGGPRQITSVIYARSCHGYALNETQKPEELVAPAGALQRPAWRLAGEHVRGQRHGLDRGAQGRAPGSRLRASGKPMRGGSTAAVAARPHGDSNMTQQHPLGVQNTEGTSQ